MAASVEKKSKKRRKSEAAAETEEPVADVPEAVTPKSEKKKKKKQKIESAEVDTPATIAEAVTEKVAEPSTAAATTTAPVPTVKPIALFKEQAPYVSIIAVPLADEKLRKKVLKLAKKAAQKKQIKRGVKEVIKATRKKQKGICIIAGDISPVDVITPLPVLCEDNAIPYIYVPSKEELGAAGLTKRPTSCMLVMPKPVKGSAEADEEFDTLYETVFAKVKAVQPAF